jgi:hypothetical protein
MILHLFHILAAAEEDGGKLIVAVIAVVIWAISALAKQAGKSSAKQKERLRQVRESIERAHAQNQPVTLDPEIARRLPPMIPQRPPIARSGQPAVRPATNYNQMTAQPRGTPPPIVGQRIPPRSVPAQRLPAPPQPIPGRAKSKAAKRSAARSPQRPPLFAPPAAPPMPEEVTLFSQSQQSARPAVQPMAARPVARPAIAAPAIKRWATPATLRQQFILTEIFQPPLALREQP